MEHRVPHALPHAKLRNEHAEMASCMVLRCIRLIFLPEIMAMATATVTTPMPPI